LKPSAVVCLSLVAFSLLSGQRASGQVQSPLAGRATTETPATWNVFVGGSGESSASQNSYGWNGSVSEYPYKSHPWIGGTVDVSGYYYDKQGVGTQLFPIMGGPSIAANGWRMQPFVRVMFGGIVDRTSTSTVSLLTGPNQANLSIGEANKLRPPPTVTGPASTNYHLGFSAGGGIDIPAGSRLAIRGQADWIEYWVSSQGQPQPQEVIRASAGVVFRF